MAFSSLNTIASSSGLGVASVSKNTMTTYSSGLYYKGYTGNNAGYTYFYGVNGTTAYYNNAIYAFSDSNTSKTFVASGTTTNITSTNISTFVGSSTTNIMTTFYGYFKPTTTGTYKFRLGTNYYANDDIAVLWIGSAGQTISSLKSSATAPNSTSSYTAYPPSYTGSNADLMVCYNIANNNAANVTARAIYSVSLTQNLYYPIMMNWAQNSGGKICELAIATPTS